MSQKHEQVPSGKKKKDGSLFEFNNDYKAAAGSVGDDDANFASPSSSQFVQRDKKISRMTKSSTVRAPLD